MQRMRILLEPRPRKAHRRSDGVFGWQPRSTWFQASAVSEIVVARSCGVHGPWTVGRPHCSSVGPKQNWS
eukprot:5941429-Alexandrium_andersonii.AAC.1